MRVLKKYPKTTNFRQFPLTFCQKVTKKLQKARKNANIAKSLCHHLNPLSQQHLTPFSHKNQGLWLGLGVRSGL
jgi:hypothetical protein